MAVVISSFPTVQTALELPWPYRPGKGRHQSMATLRIALEARLADGHRHKCASKNITSSLAATSDDRFLGFLCSLVA